MKLLRDPDAHLVAACRDPDEAGFEDAFAILFERYRERAYAIAYRVSGNQADALDIVQESFALLFRKLHTFKGTSLFSTWMFRIVTNCAIDQRRRNSRSDRPTAAFLDLTARADVADEAPGPRDVAALHEVGDHVQAAISYLSPKLRAVLALRYLEEMSYDDLAATLEVSLGTVKSRLARAHIALEQTLRTRFPELDISRRLRADDAEDAREHPGTGEAAIGGVG